MALGAVERHIDGLISRCYAGLDGAGLAAEVLRRLPGILPVQAAFFATVDPRTLLFTSAVVQEPLGAATPLFLDNEFGRADVNKFAALAGLSDPVMSLDRATKGRRSASPRYREIMAPLGLGDELRVALVVGRDCWGALCLHLEDAKAGFSDQDHTVVRRIAPHLAEGLRRAVIQGAAATEVPGSPGMLVLNNDLTLASISPQAEQWLTTLAEPRSPGLPLPVYAVAARLALSDPAIDDTVHRHAAVRLRTRDGRWLSLYATRLRGPAGDQIGVVIEPAEGSELGPLLLRAHGLTEAQTRVVELVLQGRSTREIVQELHISANTVQEHLTAVFDRFGVRSRRELVTTVLAHGQHG